MKSFTRRELLFEVLTRDTLKNVFGAYHEFTKAQGEVKKIASCDEAGRMLGKKSQEYSKKFFEKIRKEG
ncbi:MAG: hypothetical protein AB1390_05335 [Nitrospirota bacterium]